MEKYRHIDTSGLPEGYDVADLIESGVTGQALIDWIKARLRPGPPRLNDDEKKQVRADKAKVRAQPTQKAKTVPAPRTNVLALPATKEKPSILPQEYSEDSLADRFSEKYAEVMLYCGAWKKWVHWAGNKWDADDTEIAIDYARKVTREVANEVLGRFELGPKRERMANYLSSRKCITSVEAIAKSDRRHTVKPAMFDPDPWIINTPSGVVDLKTGQSRAAKRDDYCTKSTAVAPGGECPVWLRFLDQVMKGDQAMIDYLQRIAGYCLTGSIAEHVFFCCYGSGGNGKSTFLDQLFWLLDAYAKRSKMETFTEQRFVAHSSEIAMFQGARLVSASETTFGGRWNESRIKSMTGGDPITANHMRQNPFTFKPTFKLLFAFNHRPHLRQVDQAMKRRLYMIPFDFQVDESNRDKNLPAKLIGEGSGIFQWAIEGCLQWQREGLNPPDAVMLTTKEYFESEDKIAAFMTEYCRVSPELRCGSTRLFEGYSRWADESGEFVGKRKDFLELMATKGYKPLKVSGASVFKGIDLLPQSMQNHQEAPVY